MVCLDGPNNLISDPVTGLGASGKLSPQRRLYAAAFKTWHARAGVSYLDFPMLGRPFDAPFDMVPNMSDVLALVDELRATEADRGQGAS